MKPDKVDRLLHSLTNFGRAVYWNMRFHATKQFIESLL